MEPLNNKDLYRFTSKLLDAAQINNSWGLMGQRLVTLRDQNDNTCTLAFDYLIKLSDEKINAAQNKEELKEAFNFFDRIVTLDQNSRKLSSYFDYSNEKTLEVMQKAYKEKRAGINYEISENAKVNLEKMPGIEMQTQSYGTISFGVNIYQIDYQKFNEQLTDLFKYFSGNIDISLQMKSQVTGKETTPSTQQKIPDVENLVKILEKHGQNIQILGIPKYLDPGKALTKKIAVLCPNLVALPKALYSLDMPTLNEMVRQLNKLKSIPDSVKDDFILKIEQYQLKNHQLNRLIHFLLDNLNIMKLSSTIDFTDSRNAFRRQKIAAFAGEIRKAFKDNSVLQKLAVEIDSFGAVAILNDPDIAKKIYSKLLPKELYPRTWYDIIPDRETIKDLKKIESQRIVSKSFKTNIDEVLSIWTQQDYESKHLKGYGIKTPDEAIALIKKYKLTKVNLSGILGFNNEHLKILANENIHNLRFDKKMDEWPEMTSIRKFVSEDSTPEGKDISFFRKLPNLEFINICLLNGKCLSKLIKTCVNLETIEVYILDKIVNEDLLEILNIKTNIKNIRFSFSKITNDALIKLGYACPKLEVLDLTWSLSLDVDGFTEEGFRELIDNCLHLKEIKFPYLYEVPFLDKFQKKYPHINFELY